MPHYGHVLTVEDVYVLGYMMLISTKDMDLMLVGYGTIHS